MMLRDHPLMRYRGIPNWPPVWTRTRDENRRTVRGEVGILTYIYSNSRMSSKCFLVIDHEGEMYIGALIFQTHELCKQVTDFLWCYVNRPIKEIGDLDLSHLL